MTEFDADQARTAAWMGCSVEEMNNQHDSLHRQLCEWAGVESCSLMVAEFKCMTERQREIATLEENAVLHVQRWLVAARRNQA